jgi:hypothetical protein
MKAETLKKELKQPSYLLYSNAKINQIDYNKTKISKPFVFNDDGVFMMPNDFKNIKKSKKK